MLLIDNWLTQLFRNIHKMRNNTAMKQTEKEQMHRHKEKNVNTHRIYVKMKEAEESY